jgi:hypothetical protein
MSIVGPNSIDFVSLDPTGNVFLTISDHLAWDDCNEHLFFLQEKFDAYLSALKVETFMRNIQKQKIENLLLISQLNTCLTTRATYSWKVGRTGNAY